MDYSRAKTISTDGETRNAPTGLVDWLAGAGCPTLDVACSIVCADHRRLGVPMERLGQAPQSAAGDRELHRLGNSISALSDAPDRGHRVFRRIVPAVGAVYADLRRRL